MSTSQIGNRIRTEYSTVTRDLVERAAVIPVAVIGDVSHRLFSLPGGFQNYSEAAGSFSGPALTVRVRPGDNLFLHKALDLAKPGDVVVVAAGGALENALLGEMMGNYAHSRGVKAIVIDGAIRDVAGLAALPIPVIARGVTPNGPYKTGPGEIGYPVALGSVVVQSGDLVVGDGDGVIVLPREDAQFVIGKAEKQREVESVWARQIAAREWPRGWVDDAITKID